MHWRNVLERVAEQYGTSLMSLYKVCVCICEWMWEKQAVLQKNYNISVKDMRAWTLVCPTLGGFGLLLIWLWVSMELRLLMCWPFLCLARKCQQSTALDAFWSRSSSYVSMICPSSVHAAILCFWFWLSYKTRSLFTLVHEPVGCLKKKFSYKCVPPPLKLSY